MTVTTTWKVDDLKRNASTGCVETVHWRAEATDGTHTAPAVGIVKLTPKAPTDPSFIAYDSLTLDDVVTWTKAALGADQVSAYEASLADQLAAQANPTTLQGVPW